MEKNELGLRDLVSEWLDGDSDVRYRDPDEIVEDYVDTIMSNEDLENFGYTENDRDEIYEIVSEAVSEWFEEVSDIYSQAEDYDGNLAKDMLDDYEWQEIFENAPDVFKDALYKRARFVRDNFEWPEIPDLVWEVLEENVDEQLGFVSYNPATVIDNVIVNGSYGDFDEFKGEDETDEEFIEREEDNCFQIYPEERFIIYSL